MRKEIRKKFVHWKSPYKEIVLELVDALLDEGDLGGVLSSGESVMLDEGVEIPVYDRTDKAIDAWLGMVNEVSDNWVYPLNEEKVE